MEIKLGKVYKRGRGFVFVEDIKEDSSSCGGKLVIYRHLGKEFNITKEFDIGYACNCWKEV